MEGFAFKWFNLVFGKTCCFLTDVCTEGRWVLAWKKSWSFFRKRCIFPNEQSIQFKTLLRHFMFARFNCKSTYILPEKTYNKQNAKKRNMYDEFHKKYNYHCDLAQKLHHFTSWKDDNFIFGSQFQPSVSTHALPFSQKEFYCWVVQQHMDTWVFWRG